MAELRTITAYLDDLLDIASIPDYPPAHNGLQLSNPGTVTKIAAAVDATLPVICKAIESQASLLIVHHGLFWAGVQPIRGAYYEKLRLAIEHGLAIYSAHLPLDVHPLYGNNALLCRALGYEDSEPFFNWKGLLLGRRVETGLARDTLLANIAKVLHVDSVHCCPGGPESVKHLGVITGGAGSEVASVAAEGIDTFLTGEGPHHTFGLAEELGINLIYAGHYATETFGVRAIAEHLSERFGVNQVFLDHPSGL